MVGRIDVHSHLLPGIDDGCADLTESLACAKRLVEAGYTHAFCTPHIWPQLKNSTGTITPRVTALQWELDKAKIPLKVMPGGEMHIDANFTKIPHADLVTYNNAGKYALFDFWTAEMPPYFDDCIHHMRAAGITPILAHPERIDAIQNDADVVDTFPKLGLLMQCNLECLGDTVGGARQILAEAWLEEGRYFLIGSDLHKPNTLEKRIRGLHRAFEIVGKEKVWELTHTNPSKLMENPPKK